MRTRFDEQLSKLNHELISMGALCEEAIAVVANALISGDLDQASKAAPLDAEIDKMEREIESLCLKLLLSQQPVARDLRLISAALKMITDMERIGDQAADIAELVEYFKGYPKGAISEFPQIGQMARAVIKMVTESVEAFVRRDLALADAVIAYDDTVDALFDAVKRELIDLVAREREDGEFALDMLMVAKYFERIGDHAVNVAEWVVFSVSGTHSGDHSQ